MNGIVPLNKDSGVLSRKAGNAVSFLYGEKKHGHAGTLDPMAGGVLPILLGRATKLIPFLDDEKVYRAKMRFGIVTDTGDITGNTQKTSDFRPKLSDFEAVIPQFLGEITQIPPIFSALKKDGRPLYDYAVKLIQGQGRDDRQSGKRRPGYEYRRSGPPDGKTTDPPATGGGGWPPAGCGKPGRSGHSGGLQHGCGGGAGGYLRRDFRPLKKVEKISNFFLTK
jgi:hypothetical protein